MIGKPREADTVQDSGAPLEEISLPREVYTLLAQANLLRIRGDWEDAVQKCLGALRLAPDSASTHSLLGDIYENQGRYDDAMRWYQMALDVDPRSAADRMKLDRLARRQAEKSARPPARPAALEMPPAADPPAAGIGQIFRSPDAALRYGALLAALLVLLVVAFAYRQTTFQTLGLVPDQEVKSQPVVIPANPGNPPGVTPVPVAHDATEQALLDALRATPSLGASGISVYDVVADPRAASVTVTFGLLPGSDGSVSREAALRSALQVFQAAATAPSSPFANLYSIRCLMTPDPGAANSRASLIFVGDAAKSALPVTGAGETPLTTTQIQVLFSNVWWSPQLTQ